MKTIEPEQTELTNITKRLYEIAFGQRDRLLFNTYLYFRENNLPISDLAVVIAKMTTTRLYQIIGKLSIKEDKV